MAAEITGSGSAGGSVGKYTLHLTNYNSDTHTGVSYSTTVNTNDTVQITHGLNVTRGTAVVSVVDLQSGSNSFQDGNIGAAQSYDGLDLNHTGQCVVNHNGANTIKIRFANTPQTTDDFLITVIG